MTGLTNTKSQENSYKIKIKNLFRTCTDASSKTIFSTKHNTSENVLNVRTMHIYSLVKGVHRQEFKEENNKNWHVVIQLGYFNLKLSWFQHAYIL